MGYDAYHLVAPLFAARNGTMPEIDGATGILYLDASGRVHRRLAWAEFRRGEPVPLPEPGDPGRPLRTIDEDGIPLPGDTADDQTWYEDTREL